MKQFEALFGPAYLLPSIVTLFLVSKLLCVEVPEVLTSPSLFSKMRSNIARPTPLLPLEDRFGAQQTQTVGAVHTKGRFPRTS